MYNHIVQLIHLAMILAGVAAIYFADKAGIISNWKSARSRTVYYVLFPATIVLMMAEFILIKVSFPSVPWDFVNAYYLAGKDIAYGDIPAFRHLLGLGIGGYVNVPIFAWLLAPLGLLSQEDAMAVLTLVGINLMIWSCLLLGRLAKLELRQRWLLALLFLMNGPLINGIKFGNLSYYVLFLLVLGLCQIRLERRLTAGVVLGFAAVVKPPLALFGLFFLARRDMRGLTGFGAVGIATLLLSLLVFGWDTNRVWFEASLTQYNQSWLPTFNVQSIPAFIARLHGDVDLQKWTTVRPGRLDQIAAKLADLAILAVAVFALAGLGPKRDGNPVSEHEKATVQYLVTLCLCLIVSPIAWTHYYAWLLVPMAFFLSDRGFFATNRSARLLVWGVVLLTSPIEVMPGRLSNPMLWTLYRDVYVSRVLFGGLLCFGLVTWWAVTLRNRGAAKAGQDNVGDRAPAEASNSALSATWPAGAALR